MQVHGTSNPTETRVSPGWEDEKKEKEKITMNPQTLHEESDTCEILQAHFWKPIYDFSHSLRAEWRISLSLKLFVYWDL